MEIITQVLTQALDVNISYAILMDIVVGFLYLFNIILGAIIGTKESKFDLKKLGFGILKAICILLIIVGVCYILNVFALTLNLINGIDVGEELVTTLQVLGILVTTGIDISKEVIEKIKSFRALKYISYDDIKLSNDKLIETDLKG